MNFFKAVFADDEPDSESEPLSSENNDDDHSNHDDSGSDSDPDSKSSSDPKKSSPNSAESPTPVSTSGWDFGGLIKTLATKSESVIDTYKRDLQEFSTGLKAETAVFREVANRAVNELPKAGVSTFDELKTTVLKSTTQIISQGKEALLLLDQEISAAEKSGEGRSVSYNRFDARLRAIQIDKETYCLEPDDLEDYEKWKSGFVLEDKGEELGKLFEENGAMEDIYHKIVPSEIDPETFWYRYFYKVFQLKQADEVRVSILKKAIDDEEELSWDVDEDEDEDEEEDSDGGSGNGKVGESPAVAEHERKLEKSESGKESSAVELKKESGSNWEVENKVDDNVVKQKQEPRDLDMEEVEVENKVDETSNVSETEQEKGKAEDTSASKESKPASELEKEIKGKTGDSASKVGPGTTTDEDLEWDEIEDDGSDGEKPAAARKSNDKAELHKRLNNTVEDEDLSWDIEDDDEPVKK